MVADNTPCDHCPIFAFGRPCPPDARRCDDWARRSDGAIVPAAEAATAPAPAYPPLMQQAGNALAALGRVVAAAVKGEPIRVSPAVHAERLAICMGCEFNGARPAGVRCTKCGCGGLKLELATEKCPVGKW